MRQDIKHVAVIGAGTIGASWAAYFLSRGLSVTASDPSPGAPDLIRRMVEAAWPILMRLGGKADANPNAWRFEADPVAAVAGADFVQESAPERLDVKQPLLARIDATLPADVVIASSTSGLLASRLSEHCAHAEAVQAAMEFYRAIGKYPIEIKKEVPGHLANRLQAALWREAVHLVAEGVASVADVDAAISEGPGLRWALMGPHTTFHLAGGEGGMAHFLHHLLPAVTSWWDDLGHPSVDADLQRVLAQGVAEGTKGASTRDLAAWRDAALVRLLEARGKTGG